MYREVYNALCFISSGSTNDCGGELDGRRRVVLPLSLLAFAASASSLSHPNETHSRSCWNGSEARLSQIPGVHHMFRRHVGLKKQHEIKQLAEV